MSDEDRFEAWFQELRRKSWGNGYGHRLGQPVPRDWGMGNRLTLLEGWMAASDALGGPAAEVERLRDWQRRAVKAMNSTIVKGCECADYVGACPRCRDMGLLVAEAQP
jgi:hypothetical protein